MDNKKMDKTLADVSKNNVVAICGVTRIAKFSAFLLFRYSLLSALKE
jgi:hypothetical protein